MDLNIQHFERKSRNLLFIILKIKWFTDQNFFNAEKRSRHER